MRQILYAIEIAFGGEHAWFDVWVVRDAPTVGLKPGERELLDDNIRRFCAGSSPHHLTLFAVLHGLLLLPVVSDVTPIDVALGLS